MNRIYLNKVAGLVLSTVVVMSSCDKEGIIDNLNDNNTNTSVNADKELLNVLVAEASMNSESASRAAYEGKVTTFEANDAIGVYVVDSEGAVLQSNVKMTLGSDGKWSGDLAKDVEGSSYYAYFPYVEGLGDGLKSLDEIKAALSAKYNKDQSTKENYSLADYLTSVGQIEGDNTIKFSLSHNNSLLELYIPICKGTDYNEANLSVTIGGDNGYKPYYLGDGYFRYILNPAEATGVNVSGYYEDATINLERMNFAKENITLSANQYMQLTVNPVGVIFCGEYFQGSNADLTKAEIILPYDFINQKIKIAEVANGVTCNETGKSGSFLNMPEYNDELNDVMLSADENIATEITEATGFVKVIINETKEYIVNVRQCMPNYGIVLNKSLWSMEYDIPGDGWVSSDNPITALYDNDWRKSESEKDEKFVKIGTKSAGAYKAIITIDLGNNPNKYTHFGSLPRRGTLNSSPKNITIEYSDNKTSWTTGYTGAYYEVAPTEAYKANWVPITSTEGKTVNARYLRITFAESWDGKNMCFDEFFVSDKSLNN